MVQNLNATKQLTLVSLDGQITYLWKFARKLGYFVGFKDFFSNLAGMEDEFPLFFNLASFFVVTFSSQVAIFFSILPRISLIGQSNCSSISTFSHLASGLAYFQFF